MQNLGNKGLSLQNLDNKGLRYQNIQNIGLKPVHPFGLASNVLRIHSDTVCFLVLADASIDRNSPGVTRMRSIAALALPLGSAGRPTFLGLGLASGTCDLLHDGLTGWSNCTPIIVWMQDIFGVQFLYLGGIGSFGWFRWAEEGAEKGPRLNLTGRDDVFFSGGRENVPGLQPSDSWWSRT